MSGIADFNVRAIFKRNTPTPDNYSGFSDSYSDATLDTVSYYTTIVEVWCKVKIGSVSRGQEALQTSMDKRYLITIRKPPSYTPHKNDIVELVNFTTKDATIQGYRWDPLNMFYEIEAIESI